MQWINAIKEAFAPGPSKKEKHAESVRTIKAQHGLRNATTALKAVTRELSRPPMPSVAD